MRMCFFVFLGILAVVDVVRGGEGRVSNGTGSAGEKRVTVLPIQGDIDKSMVYVVRRGVKRAIETESDLLLLDMDTNGGRVDSTQKIIDILAEFKGETATYVNRKAYSAGAFISVSTDRIYMAPQSMIGAAAPVVIAPGGGIQEMPSTMEVKMTSALAAWFRAQAEAHGHNTDVVMAMIDKNFELEINGEILKRKGDLLTLTDTEARREYGEPPKPLLSAGTAESLDELLGMLGYGGAERIVIEPTGAERLGAWLMALGPLLLIIGAVGLYIEFKTPGFGLPGVIGVAAFALYFFGGYAAGLSGMEWLLVFILGLALVAVELFVFPGTIVLGLIGTALMLAAIVMALVDLYPTPGPGLPSLPSYEGNPFNLSLRNLVFAMVGTAGAVWLLSRLLPRTAMYHQLVLETASGTATEARQAEVQTSRLGQEGLTRSGLRPGGRVQIGDELVDVTSQGDFIDEGVRVRVIGYRNNVPVVEPIE